MYTAFGLGASLWKVLNFSNMLLYAEHVVEDMEFPRALPSIQEDMFQVQPHMQTGVGGGCSRPCCHVSVCDLKVI